VLAHFIEDSEDLQKLACDADAIGKLSAKLVSESVTLTPRHRENIFRALAALCSTREEGRRQLVESRQASETSSLRRPGLFILGSQSFPSYQRGRGYWTCLT
jgi:hypothetical protein